MIADGGEDGGREEGGSGGTQGIENVWVEVESDGDKCCNVHIPQGWASLRKRCLLLPLEAGGVKVCVIVGRCLFFFVCVLV